MIEQCMAKYSGKVENTPRTHSQSDGRAVHGKNAQARAWLPLRGMMAQQLNNIVQEYAAYLQIMVDPYIVDGAEGVTYQ